MIVTCRHCMVWKIIISETCTLSEFNIYVQGKELTLLVSAVPPLMAFFLGAVLVGTFSFTWSFQLWYPWPPFFFIVIWNIEGKMKTIFTGLGSISLSFSTLYWFHFHTFVCQVLACQETDPSSGEKLCSNRAITVARTKRLGKRCILYGFTLNPVVYKHSSMSELYWGTKPKQTFTCT